MTELDPFGAFVARAAVVEGGGALRGLSLAVKDSIEVAGQAFTAGHPLFAARRGAVTAPAVLRLRAAGAGFAGMTRTDAGGFGVAGAGVRNPRYPKRIVGGSTSGGAAAIAAGLADLALGTDTAGSLRIPAACVGAIGFKASHGAIDMAGIWPLAPTFDSAGFIAGAWEPLRRGVTALLAAPEAASDRSGPRIFAVEEHADYRYDAQTQRALAALRADLTTAGHRCVMVRLPDRTTAVRAFSAMVRAEAKVFYEALPRFDPARLGAAAHAALTYAARHDEDIGNARKIVAAFAAATLQVLHEVDALIAPTLPIAVPRVGQETAELDGRRVGVLQALITETCLANMCGSPAISIPRATGLRGCPPFSFSVTGVPASDLSLLDIATALDSALQPAMPVGADA